MKTIYCEGCKIKVAEIAKGSKLKKGMVMICSRCETKRKASDLASKSNTNPFDQLMKDFSF